MFHHVRRRPSARTLSFTPLPHRHLDPLNTDIIGDAPCISSGYPSFCTAPGMGWVDSSGLDNTYIGVWNCNLRHAANLGEQEGAQKEDSRKQ